MKRCMELVQTNQNFRKSVNLQLDLENYERIGSYIPTRSSISILKRYFSILEESKADNSTILIGPYGKGKSHLLLVLLALLHGEKSKTRCLIDKITKVDKEAAHKMQLFVKEERKYLPVLISPMERENLNDSFVFALRQALLRDGQDDIAPESYYSEAVRTIKDWKALYPETYQKFELLIKSRKKTIKQFCDALSKQNRECLDYFIKVYPELTSGSVFVPMLQVGALKTYQQMIRILTEERGYAGIFVVFDEFSKYIEGHAEEGFSNDMKILQEMCELANASGQTLYLTLVAHKSIREYGKKLPAATKNTFQGVEGRLTEIEFVVSAQNNYELIADAIEKKEPEFSEAYCKLKQEEGYQKLLMESWQLPCFQKLFTDAEYARLIGINCFPLAPLTCYALIHISERVAQNERTIFTFLASEEQGSLNWLLARGQEELIGIDKIYDYFKNLFRETADQPQIHSEWLKAENALRQTEDEMEQAVIKAITVIRMIHREEELPAKDNAICLALAVQSEKCKKAIERLRQKEVIVYRSKIGIYAFRNNVGVDIEKEIEKKVIESANKNVVVNTLERVSEMEYELPRQYNQKYAITRYFQYVYMEIADFLRMNSADYLFEETFADGKIITLIQREPVDKEVLQQHLERLKDERILLLVSEKKFALDALLKRYEAVEKLMQEEALVDENKILLQELNLNKEDIAFEINSWMEENYLPENGNVLILQVKKEPRKGESAAAFSNVLSEICEQYYSFSPKVNHELLNIQHVGVQYLRARNIVVKRLLEEQDCSGYLEGTNPEAMIYRAAFVHTKEDAGCERVFKEIDRFFRECAGERRSFANLYHRLCGKDYGVRKGVIPLFLAKKLSDMDVTAVVYVGNREMQIDEDALNKVNEHPENYALYLEQDTAEKEQYLQKLEKTFCVNRSYTVSKQGRISGIISCMQNWYRSLPQYSMITVDFEPEMREKVKVLRNALRKAEVNSRELIFERFPEAFEEGSYSLIADRIGECKDLLTRKLDLLKEQLAGQIKELFGAQKNSSMKACLLEWYQMQDETAKHHVFSTTGDNFMKYLGVLETNDEGEIVSKISKIILDVYVEDWHDDTREQFMKKLCQIKEQVESIQDKKKENLKCNQIILRGADGKEIERYYETDEEDTTSMYLKNVMSEALEEFGDTLEMNQKVAVLADLLSGLLQ